MKDVIPKEWLGAVVSLEDVEKDNLVDGVPFGCQAPDWEDFKAAMLEGDDVCEFASPPITWQILAGRAGYALVRNGSAIRRIVTWMN